MKEKQVRTLTLPVSLHLREAGEGESESRILEGYALKFGTRSLLFGYYYPFYEILEPGCITEEMLREQRIYFTMFHNREAILGRWDKGEGTLKLTLDAIGLKVECEAPHTIDGDKAVELAKRGDLTEMSFIYWTNEKDSENCISYEETDETTDWGAKIYLRHVKKIEGISDVTIAATPAYTDTEVKAREQQVREFVEATKPGGREEPTAEQIEAQKREKEKREASMQVREEFAKELCAIASAEAENKY